MMSKCLGILVLFISAVIKVNGAHSRCVHASQTVEHSHGEFVWGDDIIGRSRSLLEDEDAISVQLGSSGGDGAGYRVEYRDDGDEDGEGVRPFMHVYGGSKISVELWQTNCLSAM